MAGGDVLPVHIDDICSNDADGNPFLVGFRVDIRYIDLLRFATIQIVGDATGDNETVNFEFCWVEGGPDIFRALIVPLLKISRISFVL